METVQEKETFPLLNSPKVNLEGGNEGLLLHELCQSYFKGRLSKICFGRIF